MHYTLLLKTPANVRYGASVEKLALHECACILQSLHVPAQPTIEQIGGASFVAFDAEPLDESAWRRLSKHSGVCFAAIAENGLLRPLTLERSAFLPEDLPHVLKYKGKTNVDFTYLMLHCARAASAFALCDEPLTVLDPVCGRGTTLFCALVEGDNAVGFDADRKAIDEVCTYFERSLCYHKRKHRSEDVSLTRKEGGAVRQRRYTFAADADAYKNGDTRTLAVAQADSAHLRGILRPAGCHLIVGDLPYGVQHAPKDGSVIAEQRRFLHGLLPGLPPLLKPGGAIALSYNTYTLPRETLTEEMRLAGLEVLDSPPYDDFKHWVEQAVDRDIVIALRPR